MITPEIDLNITQQQLLALGNQLGLPLGPFSPLIPKTPEQQAMLGGRIISPSLVGADGRVRSEIVPIFKALANPKAYAMLAYMGRSFLLETIYYYPDASNANGNISLTDTDEGLRVTSPGVKEDVFPLLAQYIGETLMRRTEFEVNFSLIDTWVFFGAVDACRRKMLNAVLEYSLLSEVEITPDEIYTAIRADSNNMQWFSPYFGGCLSLAQLSQSDTQMGIQSLIEKGLLNSQGDRIFPSNSVTRIADEFLVIDAHLRLRMGIIQSDQPQHMDMRAIQGRSGAILYWVYDNQGVDLVSLSPAQLMLIISNMIENPAAHLSEGGAVSSLSRPTGSPSSPPERL